MTFTYHIPTKVLFGIGQLNHLHEQDLPGKKALIVISSGKSTRANGYLQRVEDELKKAKVASVVFDKILPNPVRRHVSEGAAFAKEHGCDFVIGLGGGSTIDSAKAIAIMATNEGEFWDYIGGGSGGQKAIPTWPLPIVAITTTAGTGTEADPWLVITKEETNEKIGSGYLGTFPVLSIVDPELMVTVPPHLTAYQGFDALFHSTEGYINNTANTLSDLYSLEAIKVIARSLETAVKDGSNLKAREDVALGNTLAGMVESTSGCISEHSLEHAMSAYHPNLPHGAGLIMISREYYTHMASVHACDQRMVDMAKAMGKTDAKDPMDFVQALVELQKACQVDSLKMSDYQITQQELLPMVANARANMGGLFAVDPVVLSDEDCLKIYSKSFA
ncbi:alcohol dehydrogenase, class IV [Sphaerochaeta pleomorpha str. Grapes]|uniref:Alcohol dehydrogenase, class IV n=1 Tax=Sphaerochaeta pleomorpha (strain ATCC BAA-1885 / DSM 22778 / Grapes) TaxID=158190 RepID=G8QUK0_SPHPG|nr:iron-containing alcohol dehydrogenase [Sphaerochaeta pleomorpha]AEV29233.1 alcohol dehydrogenase, class IV [Sphaerochaeta pleomorpha str. Grapes]